MAFEATKNTVETSTFGSEYVALKIGTKMIIDLRYKIRIMGVLINGIFCDNKSVVKSSVKPDVSLKKKHVLIAFHKC